MTRPEVVAVIGAGIMGRGIARVTATAGIGVRLFDVDQTALEAGLGRMRADLARSAGRGDLTPEDVVAIEDRIQPVTDLDATVGGATLVIEAAPERLELKQDLFRDLEQRVDLSTVLATNTSSLSVTAIASATTSPQRVVGVHFFNPVHRMDLVEIVRALETDPAIIDRVERFCRKIGKPTVVVQDRAGFVTSRINAMIGNEAFHMLTEGIASARDIDLALKNGLGHPMGPFELVDLVGLDTRLAVLNRLRDSLGERFRPNPLLVDHVQAGRLGRKVGKGVYEYDVDGNRIGG